MGPADRGTDGRIRPSGTQKRRLTERNADFSQAEVNPLVAGGFSLVQLRAPNTGRETTMSRKHSSCNDLVAPIAFVSVAAAWGYVAFAYFASMFAA